MKREHPDGSFSKMKVAPSKVKQMWIEEESGGGMDELLAVMGYKVRSSEMEEVALKMDQLEIMLRSEDLISNLSVDTVHYNPSDLSGWVQGMLSKLNVDYSAPTPAISDFFDGEDLRAIPGVAAYPQEAKRMRLSADSPHQEARPVVLGDAQAAGVCLVHALLACAEAVQEGSLKLADTWVKRVGALAATEPGTMKKVAFYFAEALARRIYNVHPQETTDSTCPDSLEPHFYDACPYLKFAHFAANQAILEAVSSASAVHVIDFSLRQGMQWPPLIQALAVRDGGAPTFRLTSVDPGQIDSWRLEQFADTVGVKFEFQAKNNLSEIKPEPSDKEVVVVNSVFDFHRRLARPGEIEKVLEAVKSLNPRIMTVIEMEANHNGENFLDRYTQALYYYSSLFDSLEASAESASPPDRRDVLKSELYLGQQIFNVVACEGPERFERHESQGQWRTRMERAGFESVHMGSDAYRSACLHLEHFAGVDGYRVEESDGSLMLGWHTRPIISTSAWRVKCC